MKKQAIIPGMLLLTTGTSYLYLTKDVWHETGPGIPENYSIVCSDELVFCIQTYDAEQSYANDASMFFGIVEVITIGGKRGWLGSDVVVPV